MPTEFWVWLGVTIVALVLEFITVDLVTIWFAVSALLVMILSAVGLSLTWQIVIFIVVSIALVLSFRKLCKRLLESKEGKTNVETMAGKQIKLLTAITDDQSGTAKLGDVTWTVVGKGDFKAEKGDKVEIVEIKGNKIIVRGIEK